MRAEVDDLIESGLDRIRDEMKIPGDFDAEVLSAADEAIERPIDEAHEDRTAQEFMTLDPARSVDLDQAFHIRSDGDDLILHYAIADVGWFVRPGDPLDTEAFNRGVTVYLPDGRATLYPTALSEGAASLLPDVDRPAVVFETRVRPDGEVSLEAASRAIIRSRAKLAYETVALDDLPAEVEVIYRRLAEAEDRRGAVRVDFPEQQLSRNDDGTYRLEFRPRVLAEEFNAALSLATNLAVAQVLLDNHTGLFRTMPDVDDRQLGLLHNSARALGLSWPRGVSLAAFQRALADDDPRTDSFLLAIRRASGGASYEPYESGVHPWHAALQAPYAHATAPLRRLQDRYVNEMVLSLMNGEPVPVDVNDAIERLPKAMARGDQRANRADREAVALAEAAVLRSHVGETFAAVVLDKTPNGADVQLRDPAITATVVAHSVDPGDEVTVRLVEADVESRTVSFERVA